MLPSIHLCSTTNQSVVPPSAGQEGRHAGASAGASGGADRPQNAERKTPLPSPFRPGLCPIPKPKPSAGAGMGTLRHPIPIRGDGQYAETTLITSAGVNLIHPHRVRPYRPWRYIVVIPITVEPTGMGLAVSNDGQKPRFLVPRSTRSPSLLLLL